MHSSFKAAAAFMAVGVLLQLGGCAGSSSDIVRTHFVSYSDEQREEYAAAKPGEYKIQEGDRLALIFSYMEDLNLNKIIVLPDGSVTLPGIDRVQLAGLTVSAADSMITRRYSALYKNPDLSLLVEESVGRQVYVLGEVQHPGLHPVPNEGISILNAIGAAGGYTEDAKPSQTVLVRMNAEGYMCQEIDLSKFNSLAGISYTGVGLEGYDVIYVPRSRVGDFAYFSEKVVAGLLNVTRVISDVRLIDNGYYRR